MNCMGTLDYNLEKLMENSEITLLDALELQSSPVDNIWCNMYIYTFTHLYENKNMNH